MREQVSLELLNNSYTIIEKLGESPQAVVYKVYQKESGDKLFALKVLKSKNLSKYVISDFKQRIEHLKILDYPMVITPISFIENGKTCYIIQDYFDGVTLDKLTVAGSSIPLDTFLP